MKKFLALTLVLGLTHAAQAGDHWDRCSDSGGSVTIENQELTVAGQPANSITFKVLGKTVLKKTKETCVLKKSGDKVTSYMNEASVQRIELSADSKNKWIEYVICDVGGSGVPAGDDCK